MGMRTEDLSRNAISKIELKSYGLTRGMESSVDIAAGYINMNEEFKDYLEKK
jgi:hypothetical protein